MKNIQGWSRLLPGKTCKGRYGKHFAFLGKHTESATLQSSGKMGAVSLHLRKEGAKLFREKHREGDLSKRFFGKRGLVLRLTSLSWEGGCYTTLRFSGKSVQQRALRYTLLFLEKHTEGTTIHFIFLEKAYRGHYAPLCFSWKSIKRALYTIHFTFPWKAYRLNYDTLHFSWKKTYRVHYVTFYFSWKARI